MPVRCKNKILQEFRIEGDQIWDNNNSHKSLCIKEVTFGMNLKNWEKFYWLSQAFLAQQVTSHKYEKGIFSSTFINKSM